MKAPILFVLTLLPGTALVAQCTSTVPANATVITSSTAGTVHGNQQVFWVCPEAFQQVFTGSNNRYFIEAGAWVTVNGNANDVYYKGTIPLGIFGSSNYIIATAASAISDQGSGNTVNACGAGAVVFNYGSAPANGCAIVGIEEELLSALQLSFDPVQEVLTLNAPNVHVERIRVVDMSGREVAQFNRVDTPLALRNVVPGAYVVELDTDLGTTVRRFVK
ncbi:MAG: T9SS type A sorting domain-containing protein [Flavobacteriales bacterium]|nr:T9SS type A sorting domain-containing protein [Flavobacteriales bacterium]